jgi:hypothetical protein
MRTDQGAAEQQQDYCWQAHAACECWNAEDEYHPERELRERRQKSRSMRSKQVNWNFHFESRARLLPRPGSLQGKVRDTVALKLVTLTRSPSIGAELLARPRSHFADDTQHAILHADQLEIRRKPRYARSTERVWPRHVIRRRQRHKAPARRPGTPCVECHTSQHPVARRTCIYPNLFWESPRRASAGRTRARRRDSPLRLRGGQPHCHGSLRRL